MIKSINTIILLLLILVIAFFVKQHLKNEKKELFKNNKSKQCDRKNYYKKFILSSNCKLNCNPNNNNLNNKENENGKINNKNGLCNDINDCLNLYMDVQKNKAKKI